MKVFLVFAVIGLLLLSCSQDAPQGASYTDVALVAHQDSISYSAGYLFGQNYAPIESDLNVDALVAGIVDGLADREGRIDDGTCERQFLEVRQKLGDKMREERLAAAERSKVEGAAFLEENAKKDGVVVRESGLQYKVLREGTGKSPSRTDVIVAHYRGRLLDGTVFDSSYEKDKPLEIAANRVIKGWTEALQLMREGSKWEVYIPADLGYGERGQGSSIPGGSVLIFEMELLEVK